MPSIPSQPNTYLRFMLIMLPVIIPTMAVLDAFFNASFRAVPYLSGLAFTMVMGRFLAKCVGSFTHARTPLARDKTCVMFGNRTDVWGYEYCLPERHALFLAFTTAYIMFLETKFRRSGLLSVMLIIITITSAWNRTTEPMYCSTSPGIFAGWLMGGSFGVGVSALAASDKKLNEELLYFAPSVSNRERCSLRGKKFKCTKKTDRYSN